MLKTCGAAFALVAVMASTEPAQAGGVTQLVTNGDFEATAYGTGVGTDLTQQRHPEPDWLDHGRPRQRAGNPWAWVRVRLRAGRQLGQRHVAFYGPANGVANGLTANSGYSTAGGTNGGNYVALDGDPNVNGTLSQTIYGLTPGFVYVLTFAWATGELVDTGYGITTDQFQVSLGGQTQYTQTLTTPSQGFDPWRQAGMYFTATAASETLSFLAVGSPAGEPPTALLDAVSLTYVPEPSTWAAMLAGVAGLTALTMRRRRPGSSAARG